MALFGLIGKKLGHSFSKDFFEGKFSSLGLHDHRYDLFEIETIEHVTTLLQLSGLVGLNVTVPYKEQIIPYLDDLDKSAAKVGAVNVVKLVEGRSIGYNSDYYGFKSSLTGWLNKRTTYKALVLGSGGASKAVTSALSNLKIKFGVVSREPSKGDLTYDQLVENPHFMRIHNLIINTTPLGMHPNVEKMPPIPYDLLSPEHYLYDLIYNPEQSRFLMEGQNIGAHVKNGLEMLHLQAEKSWEIWNSPRLKP